MEFSKSTATQMFTSFIFFFRGLPKKYLTLNEDKQV